MKEEQYPKDFQEFLEQFNRKMSTYRGKLFYRLVQQAVET
jgi:hypothetical protein